jgi:hypothetical protein
MKFLKRRARRTIMVLLCVVLPVCGCGSLAQKFVRKPKKQEKPVQALVLSPEVYPDSQANKEDAYRHYLALWGGWQDELIDSLSERSMSHRRELDSAQEAIDNLAEMQKLIAAEKQFIAGGYLESLKALRTAIAKDIYGVNRPAACKQAEALKRQIYGALQYKQVKDFLR